MKFIPLTQGKEAIVDDDMYDTLMRHKWYATDNQRHGKRKWYAKRRRKKSERPGAPHIYMHHVITRQELGLVIDHINGNSLDNRRANLRLIPPEQNDMCCRVRKKAVAPHL